MHFVRAGPHLAEAPHFAQAQRQLLNWTAEDRYALKCGEELKLPRDCADGVVVHVEALETHKHCDLRRDLAGGCTKIHQCVPNVFLMCS